MRYLIIFRHGDFNQETKELTPLGRIKVGETAVRLTRSVPRRGIIRIDSSPVVRARQTAEVIKDMLGSDSPINEMETLALEDYGPVQLDLVHQRISELIKLRDNPLVLVTHTPFIEKYPPYLFMERFGAYREPQGLMPGQAFVIDLEKKIISRY